MSGLAVTSLLRRTWLRLLAAIAAGVTAELCAVGLMALAAWLITRAAEQPALSALSLAIVGVRACALARGAFRYLERLVGHDAALRAVARLRPEVFRAQLGRPALRDGDALSRLVSDVDSVQELLLRCLSPAAIALVVATGSVIACTAVVPAAGVVLAGGLLVAAVALPAFAVLTHRQDQTAADRAELSVAAADLVEGAHELAAFGAVPVAVARAEQHAARMRRRDGRAARSTSALVAAGVLVEGATAVAVSWSALLAGQSQTGAAVVGFLALAAFEAVLPLTDAARRWTEHRPALRRITELLAAPPVALPPVNSEGLALHGVSVHYDRPALTDVDLTIDPGRTVAVVGASGAGKSTLLGVLAGLVPASSGQVQRPETRAVTQDAHVFSATIRDNLLLAAPGADQARLEQAAEQAGLLAWIRRQPAGFDTSVGETGQPLSGGQRQRLLLARALLSEPDVLLLDEPTEALEPELADDVLARVLRTRAGRTTIVVTHRLAGLERFDEVLVLDSGRIVQRGPHRELVAAPGPFRDLWAAEALTDFATWAHDDLEAAPRRSGRGGATGDPAHPRGVLPRLDDHRARRPAAQR
ncbi:thiol reductant ABC exporter subunit CydC [Saccharopolyspora sp. NPDC000359]|uniref:thiol reductant ABC exporter subunit CydC n=1 Tax=Saccharopolyspora sp. NPDC000359 TaxID=3154251 RepID=UPI003326648D